MTAQNPTPSDENRIHSVYWLPAALVLVRRFRIKIVFIIAVIASLAAYAITTATPETKAKGEAERARIIKELLRQ